MPEVVPAILEQTWEDVQDKVAQIKQYTNFIQLDVMDGAFVPNTTFNDTSLLSTLDITMELHLMIERPSLHIPQWDMNNVTRFIFHYEAVSNMDHTIQQIKKTGKEVAVAINPSTSTYEIRQYLNELDMVLVMGVDPGFSGQSFNTDVLEKIKELKRLRPELLVEVDGGVNDQTCDAIVEAGADILAAASFIWKSNDIGKAIAVLKGQE